MLLNRLIFTSACFVLSLLANVARADTFVYTVANHFTNFQVDGTITTNTNLGILNTNNILDYSLLINAGTDSDTLAYSSADTELYGYGLSATDTGLFFDYGQSFGLFLLQNLSNGTFVCFQTAGQPSGCDTSGQSSVSAGVKSGAVFQQAQSGPVQIGSIFVSAVSQTPEPSSFMLLGTGLAGIAGLVRRRQRAG